MTLSESSLKKFAISQNLKKSAYSKAISELVITVKGLETVVTDVSLNNEMDRVQHQIGLSASVTNVPAESSHKTAPTSSKSSRTQIIPPPPIYPLSNSSPETASPDTFLSSQPQITSESSRPPGSTISSQSQITIESSRPQLQLTGFSAQGRVSSKGALKDKENLQYCTNRVTGSMKNNILGVKAREKKCRRTLLEDQRETNKKFIEKIISHASGYTCKLCTFATGILLKAKTHALTCGKKKKKMVKKIIHCQDCT